MKTCSARATIAAATLLLAAACGQPTSTPTAQTETPDGSDQPSQVSPVDVDADFVDREAKLHDAEQELVRQCMAEAGFEFATTSSSVLADQRDQARRDAPPPFGSDDVDAATLHGYQLGAPDAPESDLVPADQENVAFYETLPPADRARYDQLLNPPLDDNVVTVPLDDGRVITTPAIGCVTDARRAPYDDLPTYLKLSHIARNLTNETHALVEADDRNLAVRQEWAACMETRGMTFAAWYEAYAAAIDDPATETTLAVADATCALEVGSVETAMTLLEEHEQAVLTDRRDEMVSYGQLLGRALERTP